MSIMWLNSPLDIYPVGALYLSTVATSPATLFGGVWERIQGKFLLAASDVVTNNGAQQRAGSIGGVASVTLTGAQSGIPPHVHALSNHVHEVPAHTHPHTNPSVVAVGDHTHKMTFSKVTNGTGTTGNGPNYTNSVVLDYNVSWNLYQPTSVGGGGHGHSLTGGSVDDSTPFDTEPGGGGYTETMQGSSASEEHTNMPPFLAVYMWVRTA